MSENKTYAEAPTESIAPEPVTAEPVDDVPEGGEFLDQTDEIAEDAVEPGPDRSMPGIDVNPGSERQGLGMQERSDAPSPGGGNLPGEKGGGGGAGETPGHG